MIPVFSRKSSVFLILGVFALLFGVVQGASAATCASYGDSSPYEWQRTSINDCTIKYDDPTGGSNLFVCQYRVLSDANNNRVFESTEETLTWTNATHSDPTITCSGNSATLQADISIGSGLNCPNNGENKCEVEYHTEDNAGNSAEDTVVFLDIDYSPPSGGSISYADGFTALTSVALTVSDGTDADSGINTSTRTVQRKSATLSEGVCGTYGSFTDISPSGIYPSFTNSGLVSGTCYQYRYLVSDNAGNPTTYNSPSVVKVDTAAPVVSFFDVDPEATDGWVNIATPNAIISWNDIGVGTGITDAGGSGLKQIEVWRAWDANGDGVRQESEWSDSSPDLGTQANPIHTKTTGFTSASTDDASYTDTTLTTNGTYWYGLHVKDNADNMGYEPAPEKVQVDKTAPTVSAGGVPANWQNSDATASVGCSDTDCNATTYKLQTYTSSGICSAAYNDYTFSSPKTINSHLWVCAAAKDNAGNAGFSDADSGTAGLQRTEFKVDKTLPSITSFSPNRVLITVANRTLDFSWTATDTGDSGLKEAVLWRKLSSEGPEKWAQYGNPQTASGASGSGTFSETFSLNVEQTYDYGIHIKDQALNECNENTDPNISPCGDTTQNKTPPDTPDTTDQVYTRTIQVDTKAPSGSIVMKAYTTSASVMISLTCDIANDCKKMKFSNDGTTFGTEENFASAKSWTLSAPDGTKTVYVQFQDNAGNWSSSFPDSIILDTQAPVVSFDSPDTNSWQNQDFTVQYDATDANINTCKLWTKDGAGSWIDRGTITCGSDKTKSIDIDLWCTTQGLGQCEVWIPASDLAGRTNQAVRSFSIDTIAPPKPTCTPAGGTFQNRVNNVTCSAESGAIIRYTLTQDGSSPDLSSTLYSAPFDITSTAILTVAAWDIAGNRSADNSYSFTIAHNRSPNITSNCNANPGCDSPDPIKANTQIAFTIQGDKWNDLDGDSVTFFVCKNSTTPSGGDCSGGSTNRWCRNLTAISPGTNATCSYTTAAADAGTKDYYAFVCDDENACSNAKSGTFLVDTQAPTVTTFVITPASPSWANPSITVTWNVSDQGGSHLDRVRAYRAVFDNTDPDQDGKRCDDANKEDCIWLQAGSDAIAPNNSDNWNCGATCNDRIVDSPGSGTWWYGMHVVDKAGNCTREDGSACTAIPGSTNLKKALVDTINPSTAVTNPGAGNWFSNNFDATFSDSDSGGSELAPGQSGCQYKFTGINIQGQDALSGDIARACGSSVIKNISVGVSPDICRYQGINTCTVETKSFDVAGNNSGWQQRSFSVDFSAPTINAPSPGAAQAGVSTQFTSTSLQDSVGHITGCTFYTTSDGWLTWTADSTTVSVNPSGDGESGSVSANHTFTTAGSYEARFACSDAAGHTGWGAVSPVQVGSLSVDLSAVPSPGGSVHTPFDLTADTAGSTMSGDTTYGFDCRTDTGDCTADGNFADCDFSITTNATAYTKANLCQYPVGTYTAKVAVQRGVGTAQDTASIGPIVTNSAPEAAITCDPASCVAYDSGILTLRNTSSDLDGAEDIIQSTWDILGFGAGSELTCPPGPVLCNYTIQPMPTGDYTVQLSVEDSQGDTDNAQRSFTLKRDIAVNFECSLDGSVWQACSTVQPSQGEVVQFRDASVPSEGASVITSWIWTFQDGSPASANTSVASTVFQSSGSKTVTLRVTDNDGRARTGAQAINLAIPFPEWQEISPF